MAFAAIHKRKFLFKREYLSERARDDKYLTKVVMLLLRGPCHKTGSHSDYDAAIFVCGTGIERPGVETSQRYSVMCRTGAHMDTLMDYTD